MIPNIKLEHVNQEILAENIKALEWGYVETLINLIKWPVFIKACEDDLAKDVSDERKEALMKTLIQHQKNQENNELAIIQLNTIITDARTYLTK